MTTSPIHAPDRRLISSPARLLLVPAAALLWIATLAGLASDARGWALLFATLATAPTAVLAFTHCLSRRLVAVTVRGPSMEPTYRDGDRVIVRRGTSVTVGQVVVVERPAAHGGWPARPIPARAGASAVSRRQWMIKRVDAVPGDPAPTRSVPALANTPDGPVPPGKLVLLGDNREASYDSRQLGYFPMERILGTLATMEPSAQR